MYTKLQRSLKKSQNSEESVNCFERCGERTNTIYLGRKSLSYEHVDSAGACVEIIVKFLRKLYRV